MKCCVGKHLVKLFQDICQRDLLLRRACVLGSLAILLAASYIAYSDAVCVVIQTMCAYLFKWTAIVNGAIEVYHFVIADTGPMLFLAMDFIYSLDCHRLTYRRSGTMDYNFVNSSHALSPSSLSLADYSKKRNM